MMKFVDAYILWGLLLLLPLTGAVVWYIRKRNRSLAAFATARALSKIAPAIVQRRAALKPIFVVLALGSLIFALAGPQFGASNQVEKSVSSDIVIALDVSRSMLAEDVQPSRLEKAKQAISSLLKKLKGDRVALVVFAGKAYIQMPLTNDYSAGEMFVQAVNPNMVAVQGTNLSAAIEKARFCFPENEENPPGRSIILITDGENHEADPSEQVELAKEDDISIFTVGIGNAEGGSIPVYENGVQVGYKTDRSGKTVVSKLDEKILTDIATATGGKYVPGNNTIVALDRVRRQIDDMEKKERKSVHYTERENRYQFFVLFAILLLLAEYVLSERRSLKKRLKRLFE